MQSTCNMQFLLLSVCSLARGDPVLSKLCLNAAVSCIRLGNIYDLVLVIS